MDASHTTSSLSFPEGLATASVHADIAFIGALYEENETVAFSELSLEVEGLNAWLSVSGIEVEQDYASQTGLIRFHVPDDIKLTITPDLDLWFRTAVTPPSISWNMSEAVVRQTALALMRSRQPQPIAYFSSLAFKLCNFLTLALDHPVSIQSMTGYLDHPEREENRRIPVKIYSQFGPWPERKPSIRHHDILFRLHDIEDQLEMIMATWFEKHELLSPAFNLYFASRSRSTQFLDVKFLWLAQALESLHRRTSDETAMPVGEFRSLCDSLMEVCPQSSRQWLKAKLDYANELTLRKRIGKLIDPFEQWFGGPSGSRNLINMVCETRNYLTHYGNTAGEEIATSPSRLYPLYGKLEVLLQLQFLGIIGLDATLVANVIDRNQSLRRKLDAELT